MKEIQLTQGKVALVDEEDYERLSEFRWFAIRRPIGDGDFVWYAARHPPMVRGVRGPLIFMHADVLGAEGQSIIDHKDGDGINNQRCNLRFATPRQNARNQTRKTPGCTSVFRGVHRIKSRLWRAMIRAGEQTATGQLKPVNLGQYETELEAAWAYDAAAWVYFGEFASPNFPGQSCPVEYIGSGIGEEDVYMPTALVSRVGNKWRAYIRVRLDPSKKARAIHLGYYLSRQDAVDAQNAAEWVYENDYDVIGGVRDFAALVA